MYLPLCFFACKMLQDLFGYKMHIVPVIQIKFYQGNILALKSVVLELKMNFFGSLSGYNCKMVCCQRTWQDNCTFNTCTVRRSYIINLATFFSWGGLFITYWPCNILSYLSLSSPWKSCWVPQSVNHSCYTFDSEGWWFLAWRLFGFGWTCSEGVVASF